MTTERWAVKIKERGAFTSEVYAVDIKFGHDLRCVGIAVAADASLIAAAPDLLAACEGLLNAPQGGLTGEEFTERRQWRDIARAAIAKAKGGK